MVPFWLLIIVGIANFYFGRWFERDKQQLEVWMRQRTRRDIKKFFQDEAAERKRRLELGKKP
jgi:hypothetical protein